MTCFLDIFDFLARYLFQSISHYFPPVLSNWSRIRKLMYLSHSMTFSRNINLELDVVTLYWKRWHIDSVDLGGPIFLLLFCKIACLKMKEAADQQWEATWNTEWHGGLLSIVSEMQPHLCPWSLRSTIASYRKVFLAA